MKKAAFETIGCRLNQYDTERIAAKMSQNGFHRVEFSESADIYIINTCTVTGRADASCRNIISRAARQEGSPPVVVVGCYVVSDPDKVADLNGVDLIVNNEEKESIISILQEKFPHLFEEKNDDFELESIKQFHDHNRAWIKIGDGCNQRCTYCIIPSVRGSLINRPPEEIVVEINSLSQNGYHEAVLTGIHIGQYRHDFLGSIADLIVYLLDKTDIARLRLSSIEPQEVDEKLIKVVNEFGPRVCRHFHIPLQSGSNRILGLMRRPYTRQDYLEIVKRVRDNIKNVIIGGDIIVGFPGETDEDFNDSVEAADSGLLDYLHVFSYSDRPGTDASAMPEKIKPDIIKERNAILRGISDKYYTRALQREVGKTAFVISEHRSDKQNRFWGITDNYLKVLLPEGTGGGKEIVNVKITKVVENYLTGDIL